MARTSWCRRPPHRASPCATTCPSSRRSRRTRPLERCTCSRPRHSAATSWQRSGSWATGRTCTSRQTSMTATPRHRSEDASGPRARSWSPTRTCCTPRSCPTTRRGSSCSSSCATSSWTRRTPIGVSLAATWPTSCAGSPGSAPTTAPHLGSSAARPRSATRRSSPGPSPGATMRVIDRNGAPSGEKHVIVLDPPVIDSRTGARPGPAGLARRSALAFLRAGRQTIVFGRSRVQVELLLTSLKEQLRDGRGPIERVRGYRGGYLPSERRAIEAGLRTGRDPGRREHHGARAGHRHRSPGRGGPGRLSGHHLGDLAADRAGGPATGAERRDPGGGRRLAGPVRGDPP